MGYPITPFYRPEHRVSPSLGAIAKFRGAKIENIKRFFADERNIGRKFPSLALHDTFGTTAFRTRVSDINKKTEHADYGFVIRNEHFWDEGRQCERSFYWSEHETRLQREIRLAKASTQ